MVNLEPSREDNGDLAELKAAQSVNIAAQIHCGDELEELAVHQLMTNDHVLAFQAITQSRENLHDSLAVMFSQGIF